jgi:hypothetical protein
MSRVLDPFRFVLIAVAGWMNQHQRQAMNYLKEENRVLREQLRERLCLSQIPSNARIARVDTFGTVLPNFEKREKNPRPPVRTQKCIFFAHRRNSPSS